MARGIVAALAVPLSSAEEHALRAVPTTYVEAYDAYLRGTIRLRRENREDDSLAIMELERAVAIDPDFAIAQAQLARAYLLRVEQFAASLIPDAILRVGDLPVSIPRRRHD